MSYFPPMVSIESMLILFSQWEGHMSTLEQTTQVQKHSTSSIIHPDDKATQQLFLAYLVFVFVYKRQSLVKNMGSETFEKGIDISIILEQFFVTCVERFYVT